MPDIPKYSGIAEAKSTLWSCPSCGRRFRHANQWHSCQVTAEADHFAGKPAILRETYDALIAGMKERCPDMRVDSVKTNIHFFHSHNFAGLSVRYDRLNLVFQLAHPLANPRIVGSQPIWGNRILHRVRLSDPADVDGQLLDWLAESAALVG